MEYDKARLRDFYAGLLKDDFMPFWKKACDTEHGGVFTCFTNDGSRLESTDKYIWSQGRFLWQLSRYVALIDSGLVDDADRDFFFGHAQKTYKFLLENAILPPGEGVCAYMTRADGTKVETLPGKGFYTSYFVDTFVIMGFAEFAKLAGNAGIFEQALGLYDRTRAYLDRGEVVSEPYPQPAGFRVQANAMILCNVTQVLYEAAERLGHPRYEALVQDAVRYTREILDVFYEPEKGLLREHVGADPKDNDALFASYIMPGHAVESMWFCRNVAVKAGMGQKYLDRLRRVIKNSIRTGWDREYGGLLRMVGFEGEKPHGRRTGHPQEQMFLDTWDSKLWWPHGECLWATLQSYEDTGDAEFLELYEMLSEYAFRVFPNPNRAVGEWIQIRDRAGAPMNKVVGLPVKDPYHLVRNFILIVELMGKTGAEQGGP